MSVKIEVNLPWGGDKAAYEAARQDAIAKGAIEQGGHLFTESYVGCVFGTTSESLGFGDFSRYAIVWDDALGKIIRVNYQYTGLGGSDYNSAEVDITPERYAKALALALPGIRDGIEAELENEAATVRQGKWVQVVRGRKIAIGSKGFVKWAGETRYGHAVLLSLEDGSEKWTDLSNVEVIQPSAYLPGDRGQIIERRVAQESKGFWLHYWGN